MSRRFLLIALSIASLAYSSADCWARGGGGGARGGGGGGGASRGGGGGFSGGARPSPGPSYGGGGGGGRPSPANYGGGMSGGPRPGGVGAGGAGGAGAGAMNRAPGGATAAARPGGAAAAARPGGAGSSGPNAQGAAANRFSSPSQNQLGSFLGLPSDEGLGHASARPATASGANQRTSANSNANNNFDVNTGTAEGPRGGQAAGVTVTGPQGNTVGRAAGVGADGGTAVVGGAKGADGGAAARGAAVGPGGQAVAGRGAVGPNGYGGGAAVTAGPAGAAAGFTRVTPSGRYTTAAAVRGNYNNWGVYGQGWYAQYPGAWVAAGMTAGALWNASTWGSASQYCGYSEQPPVYYDYGNSVVYEDNNVYVNGDSAGTTEEYYDQAATIATAGAEAEAPADGDWLPLGVFALSKPDQAKSDVTIQLAVSKQGIIRGNYTDTAINKNQVVQGSVDKQTQRVAFTVGDNKTGVVETGLYNLTKDEAPCLIHMGKDRTEQWLLVRLKNPETASN